MTRKKYIVCHYGEIALKGKNRPWFENTLRENISHALIVSGIEGSSVKRRWGRIIVSLSNGSDELKAEIALNAVFGITSFSFARMSQSDIKEIGRTARELLRGAKFGSFAIDARRSDKTYSLTSKQINEDVGKYIADSMQKRVDLENPDAIVYIEVIESGVLIYTKKIPGSGGLPVGTSGRALVLLSGGIDSPVAGYMMMKRGVVPSYVHFHSVPYTSRDSIDKTRDLVKTLAKFHPSHNAELYLAPLSDIQKNITYHAPEKFRVLLYRRSMLKIAQGIATRARVRALITGESLGQVASQTIENITATGEASALTIFRPLIGFDKQEIINTARKIGTYEISILPHQDCCSLFEPKRPETRAVVEELREAEQKLKIDSLIENSIQSATCEKYP